MINVSQRFMNQQLQQLQPSNSVSHESEVQHDIFDEMLEEVRRFRCIWDPSCRAYKETQKKNKLGRKYIQNWEKAINVYTMCGIIAKPLHYINCTMMFCRKKSMRSCLLTLMVSIA